MKLIRVNEINLVSFIGCKIMASKNLKTMSTSFENKQEVTRAIYGMTKINNLLFLFIASGDLQKRNEPEISEPGKIGTFELPNLPRFRVN